MKMNVGNENLIVGESVKDLSLQSSTITSSHLVPHNVNGERKDNPYNSSVTLYVELSPWMYTGLQFVTLRRNMPEAAMDLPATAVVGRGCTGLFANNIHLRRLHFSGVSATLYLATKTFYTNPHQNLIQTIATTQQTFSFMDLWHIFNAQEINSHRKVKVKKLCPFVARGFGLSHRHTRQLESYAGKGRGGAAQCETSHDIASQYVATHKLTTQDVTINSIITHNTTTKDMIMEDVILTAQNVDFGDVMAQCATSHDKAPQYVAIHNLTTQGLTTHDGAIQDDTTNCATSHKLASQYVTTQDETTNDATTQDVTTNDLTTQDVATQVVTTNDMTTQDGTTKDITTHDLTTQDVLRHDPTIHDVATQDGTTQDGTTQDGTIQIVEKIQEDQLKKTNIGPDNKHVKIKDELFSSMCSQLEDWIKSITTGTQLVNQPFVEGLKNQRGVLGLENQPGVLGLENQPGVLGLENQPRVLGLENQPGVLGLENQPGVLVLENQPGVLGLENQPGVLGLENQPGVLVLENQPGVLGLENQPGVLGIENQPHVLGLENQPGVLGLENPPGVLEVENQPCVLEVENQPCVPEVENQPCVLEVENQPCVLEVENQPCVLEVENQPCVPEVENQPCVLGLENQPVVLGSENQCAELDREKLSTLKSDKQETEVHAATNIQINSSVPGTDSSISEVSDRLKLFEFFPPKGNTLQSPFSPNLPPTSNNIAVVPASNGELSDSGNPVINTPCPSGDISHTNNLNLTTDPISARIFPQHTPLFPEVSVNGLPKSLPQSLLPDPIPSAISVSVPTSQQATQQMPQQATQQSAQETLQAIQHSFYLAAPVGSKFCQMPALQANPLLFANHNLPQFQHPMVANPVYDNRFYQTAPSTTFTVPPPLLMFPTVSRWQQVPSGRLQPSDGDGRWFQASQSCGRLQPNDVDGRCFLASQSSHSQVNNNNSWGQQTQEQLTAGQWESLGHGESSLVVGQSTSVSTRASVNHSKQTKLPRGQSAFTALSHHRQMYVPSEKTYATAWRNEYDPVLKKIRLLAYRVMRNDLNLFDYQCAEQILVTAAHLKDIKITCVITNNSEWRVSMDNILLGFAAGQWIQARERAYSIALQKVLSCDLRLVNLDKDNLELHVSFEKLNEPTWMNSADIWSQALKRKDITKKSNSERISSKGPMDKFKHVDEVILLDPDTYKSAAELLWDSATSCDMLLEYEVSLEAGRIYCCKVRIENSLVADGCAYNKEDAVEAAATQTVKRLKEVCWVIETKPDSGCDEIPTVGKAGIAMDLEGHFALKEDNVGYKLLKKMGWSGGGMGKNETGITKPVSYLSRNTRVGLGHDSAREGDFQFKCLAHEFLMAYSTASDLDDMVFSNEFTHEEMIIMCNEGKQFLNLEMKIETKGDNKFMYVSKKRSPYELFDLLMLNKGETARFRLKSPGSAGSEVKCAATTKKKKT